MQQVTSFVWQRVPSLLVAVPLISASYVILYGLMVLTQAPMPIIIDITGGSYSESRFQSDEDRQAWQRQQLLVSQAWQLQKSYGLSVEKASKFAGWMHDAVDETGVPFPILAGVIATESDFRYEAESWAGAIGPAQVIPRYWAGTLCQGDLHHPGDNVLCGAKVLMHYHTDYCQRDWVCTLSHYNVGPGNLRSGEIGFQQAAQRYVDKVTYRLNKIRHY